MKYKLKVNNLEILKKKLKISITGEFIDCNINEECLSTPKVILLFDNGIEDRRIPIPINSENITFSNGKCMFFASYDYYIDSIFWKTEVSKFPFNIYFNINFVNFYEEKIKFDLKPENFNDGKKYYSLEIKENHYVIKKAQKAPKTVNKKTKKVRKSKIKSEFLEKWNLICEMFSYIGKRIENLDIDNKKRLIRTKYELNKNKKVKPNKITFYSTRREECTGNFKFVYDKIKQDKDLDIKFIFNTKSILDMTNKEIDEFVDACATSKVVVLDEFTPQIYCIKLKPETKLIQLWHACGAFKTFGFSRLGKPYCSSQKTQVHRSYDYVTVSSEYCKKSHSEGFGIPTANVIPTGIPRTDVFFDEEYKKKIKDDFYKEHPNFTNKKIILFAPTFRGDIKEEAYYPMDLFNIKDVCDYLGDEYAIIIKHHPFVKEKHYIPREYTDRVIDLSNNMEINDLLFVADLVITDYSSLVFEASLLNLPMLFYAYDLKEYIQERDFYFDYEYYIPGKICMNLQILLESIKKEIYNMEKMVQFRDMFFDKLDGNSSQRVANLLYSALKEV